MQGSLHAHDVHAQDYRQLIAQVVRAHHPDVEIVDPWELHPDALNYTPEQASETLMKEIELAGTCDVLVAYVPEASMGSSLEMWAAYRAGAAIFTISKMTTNWVIQSLSTQIHPTLEDFLAFMETGGLSEALDGRVAAG
jgi:hypothetical protein